MHSIRIAAFFITTAFTISACFLPPKPSEQDFCENQPASVDIIIAAQDRGAMTKEEIESFFDLLWLAQVKCDEADKAGISKVRVELEILARNVDGRESRRTGFTE